MLNRDFEFESLIKICVRTCEMNSTLGSVVALALFTINLYHRSAHKDRRRAYKCSHCQKSFELWQNLRRHMKEKHGDMTWQCNSCEKTFDRRQNLVRHFRTKHPGSSSSLTPLVKSIQAKIDDLLNRQQVSPLSKMEEAKMRNLCSQKEILMRLEEEESQGTPPERYALQVKKKRKSPFGAGNTLCFPRYIHGFNL